MTRTAHPHAMKVLLTEVFPRSSRWLLGACGAAALVGLAVFYSPLSPVALDHAALFDDRPEARVSWYESVAAEHGDDEVVAEALYQAAVVDQVELGDHEAAIGHLQQLVVVARGTAREADAWEQLGRLELRSGKDPAQASRSFHKAWRLDREAVEAPARLEAAARAAWRAEETARTLALFDRLATEHPKHAAAGLLGRAEVQLAQGDVHEALMTFDEALVHDPTPEQATVARLGASICLDRLGDLDQAIAAVDAAEELPSPVRDVRRAALWERQRLAP